MQVFPCGRGYKIDDNFKKHLLLKFQSNQKFNKIPTLCDTTLRDGEEESSEELLKSAKDTLIAAVPNVSYFATKTTQIHENCLRFKMFVHGRHTHIHTKEREEIKQTKRRSNIHVRNQKTTAVKKEQILPRRRTKANEMK